MKVGLVPLGNRWTWAYYDPAFPGRRVRVENPWYKIYRLMSMHSGRERVIKGDLIDVCAHAADMIAGEPTCTIG